MIITSKALIVTTLVALTIFGGTAIAASLPTTTPSISTTGNIHGKQTLTPVYQNASPIVTTANPQAMVMTAQQLQPTANPQH